MRKQNEEIIVKAVEFLEDLDQDKIIDFLDEEKNAQIVDREVVKSKKNVIHAVKETEKAYEQGNEISHVETIGILLRLVGTRQISEAIEKAKVKGKEAVFISFGSNSNERWEEFKEKFKIKEKELPKASEEEIKKEMEKASTFWIR